jgi:hypothetical protein
MLRVGKELVKDPIIVAPVVHHSMGGIVVNDQLETPNVDIVKTPRDRVDHCLRQCERDPDQEPRLRDLSTHLIQDFIAALVLSGLASTVSRTLEGQTDSRTRKLRKLILVEAVDHALLEVRAIEDVALMPPIGYA